MSKKGPGAKPVLPSEGGEVAVPVPKPGGTKPNTATQVGLAALGVGGTFAAVYGAIMLFPKAVGNAVFPFLPEEFRPFASCCSSCLSVIASAVVAIMMMMR